MSESAALANADIAVSFSAAVNNTSFQPLQPPALVRSPGMLACPSFLPLPVACREMPLLTVCAVCNNSRCEYGEQCTNVGCVGGCPADCPPFAGPCPATPGTQTLCGGPGVGVCVPATGQCQCAAGRAGLGCSTCAANFTRVGSVCVFLPGSTMTCSNGKKDGSEEGVDCGGPVCPSCSEAGMPTFVWTVIGLATVTGVVIVILVARAAWARRATRRSSKQATPFASRPRRRGSQQYQRQSTAASRLATPGPLSGLTDPPSLAGLKMSPNRTRKGIFFNTKIVPQPGGSGVSDRVAPIHPMPVDWAPVKQ